MKSNLDPCLISVITVCKNDYENLLVTKKSLDSQTFRDFEWIVIDGNSSDSTQNWLSKNVSKNCWLSEPDRGIGDAWNKGIHISSGKFILILNAGDTYYPNALQEFSRASNYSAIVCSHANLVKDSHSIGIFKANPKRLWRGMHLPHNWCLIPRSIYADVGPYSLRKYSMDYEWFLRFIKKYGNKFLVLDIVLGDYKLGGLSDRQYAESFHENYRLMVGFGINKITAFLITTAYKIKHRIKYG